MAKKLRKVTTPPRLLMLEMLIPWIVMGIAALLGLYIGMGDVSVTIFALACALTTTIIVRFWEQKRRRAIIRNLDS
jgi:positive regulator of sigma E activity